jgi:nucleotide-binding universal stress UspA family protein
MLKSVLVHIPSERPLRPVIDGAISLAKHCSAELAAVAIGYETTNVALAVDGGAAVAAVFEIERERALARANAALAIFEAEARNAGISYRCHPLTGTAGEAGAIVGAMARLHDLSVVQQPDSGLTFDNTMPEEILFESGAPVLFIPHTHKGEFKAGHVGIAWDGSRAAARALRDAMPFLAGASRISAIIVGESGAKSDAHTEALVAYLAKHGLDAKIERTSADRGDIQPAILSLAADTGIDILIMGGYGHSRMQERFLGGVTRSMLRSMTVPTLMSH